jgi:hypothetical protein
MEMRNDKTNSPAPRPSPARPDHPQPLALAQSRLVQLLDATQAMPLALAVQPSELGPVASAQATDFLPAGQRLAREYQAKCALIRGLPGVRQITAMDAAEFCVRESKLIDNKELLEALRRYIRARLIFQECDEHGTVAELNITIDSLLYNTRLSAQILGTALERYNRTCVPDQGIEIAGAIKEVADFLLVLDPIHGYWRRAKRVATPRAIDPLLLAVLLSPYEGLPDSDRLDASLFSLCQW